MKVGIAAASGALSLLGLLYLQAGPAAASASNGPAEQAPACTRSQVRLSVSLPGRTYYAGAPVPFRVHLANVSGAACRVTALEPPDSLTTGLAYVRIFNARQEPVLLPNHYPGLRAPMVARVLSPRSAFTYRCTWDGLVGVARPAMGAPASPGGTPAMQTAFSAVAAPPGAYTAVAVLTKPALQSPALHFVLLTRPLTGVD